MDDEDNLISCFWDMMFIAEGITQFIINLLEINKYLI